MSKACRLLFEKTGRAKYISHLDLQHTIQRAFIRAGITMKHSQGFNPHPYMSVALPLSVGCESICELMDTELETDIPYELICQKLNPVMPEGLVFLQAYEPAVKFKYIKWISVTGLWEYDNHVPDAEALNEFFRRESIVIEKKTKRGMGETNIAPAIREACFVPTDKGLAFKGVLSAQEPSLNPDLLVKAVAVHAPELIPDAAFFRREKLFDADGNPYC